MPTISTIDTLFLVHEVSRIRDEESTNHVIRGLKSENKIVNWTEVEFG